MIRLTRLDGSEVTLNCDLVESVERTPDTVVTLLTGRKYVARESVEEVVRMVTEFKRLVGMCPLTRERAIQFGQMLAADPDREGGSPAPAMPSALPVTPSGEKDLPASRGEILRFAQDDTAGTDRRAR